MNVFEQALARGIPWTFALVFGAGFATSLTPCVYPMIPITVSLFGGQQRRGRAHAFLLACAYVLGIALMYAGLGIVAGLSGWAIGGLLASPWFVLPVSLLLVFFAASMFGFWEISIPGRWANYLAAIGGNGYTGAFAMGLVGGILIVPCTGPVLAGLLIYLSATHDILLSSALLFTYALGIGVLFLALAGFSLRLPPSGRWMNITKTILGIPLLAGAFYFLTNAFPQLSTYGSGQPILAWIQGGLIAAGVAIGALHLSFQGSSRLEQARKTVGIVLITLGLCGLINFASSNTRRPLPWLYNETQALAAAQRARKPLLIDFWARWCLPCKKMEHQILQAPALRRALGRFILFKADVSEDTATDRLLKKKYNAHQLPQIVLLDRRGRVRVRVGKVKSVREMLRLLNKVN